MSPRSQSRLAGARGGVLVLHLYGDTVRDSGLGLQGRGAGEACLLHLYGMQVGVAGVGVRG
jgi:hypothetical protein